MQHANKLLHIRYLRHGVVKTGGARHEEFFFESLCKQLQLQGIDLKPDTKIANRIFRGLANIKPILWAWFHTIADVNVVVGRIALSSILRNWFSYRKTIIVLHNFDRNDHKGALLARYYDLLFWLLKKCNPKKVSIVCVSPFFKAYFSQLFPQLEVMLFPNIFEVSYYQTFSTKNRDPKKILLGQYSSKNDTSIYSLAEMLSLAGYQPFFATLRKEEVCQKEHYAIKQFTFEEYLNELAHCNCSISLSGVHEGWPRMVHESFLVGTPVIGYDKGGLGDLLKEANGYIVQSANDAFQLIKRNDILPYRTDVNFIKKYDITSIPNFIKVVITFILKH